MDKSPDSPTESPKILQGEDNSDKKEAEEQLSIVLAKLHKLDGMELVDKVTTILNTKLFNEYAIAEYLRAGVEAEEITVEDAAKLITRSKDSISDLTKVKQLLEGRPTEHIMLSEEELEELDYLRRGLGRG